MKILIVEDEPSLREVMQRALRQEGYVVETAATYAEADRRVSGYDYDCILLDIATRSRTRYSVWTVARTTILPSLSIRPSCWPASKACCAAAAAEEI